MIDEQKVSIEDKIYLLRETISPRGALELLAEESSEVIKVCMKCIRTSDYCKDGTYPVDKEKYNPEVCILNLRNEMFDFITCLFLLYVADDINIEDFILNGNEIEKRLDKMIARIKENENA